MHSIFRLFFFTLVPLFSMGTQILVLPSSAEELSIGTHPTLSGLFSMNPALFTANQRKPYLLLNRGNWLGDVSLSQISYNQTITNKVTHFGLKYSGLTDLEFRGDIPQDDASANFSAYGLVLDAGLSIQNENHRFGFSVSYIHFGIYTEEAKGLSADFGYALNMKNGYSLGMVLQNIGKMTKLDSRSPKLPSGFSAGVSKNSKFNEFTNTVFASMEWNSVASVSKVHLGNKFSWNKLDLMAGYSTSKEITESSIGIGFDFNRFNITYGTRIGSQDIGFPKIISLEILLP
tara:strand:+ start:484 stop:1350 length:867 start_codon:yes stop_codon:yes gene_type:complete